MTEITISNGVNTIKLIVNKQTLSEKIEFFSFYFDNLYPEPIIIHNVNTDNIVAVIDNSNTKNCELELHKLIVRNYLGIEDNKLPNDLIISDKDLDLLIHVGSLLDLGCNSIKLINKLLPENYDLSTLSKNLLIQMKKYSYETHILMGTEQNTYIFEKSGTLIKTLDERGSHDIFISNKKPNSKNIDNTILSANRNKNIVRIYNVETEEKHILEGYRKGDYTTALCCNECLLITGSEQGYIEIWDIKTYKSLNVKKIHNNSISAIIINDNFIISSDFDKYIKISDFSGNVLHNLTNHTKCINDVIIYDNKIISGSSDGTIKIWTLTGELIRNINNNVVVDSIFIFDNIIYSVDNHRKLKTWKMDGTYCKTLHTGVYYTYKAKISYDATTLYFVYNYHHIIVWDLINNILISDITNGNVIKCMNIMQVETPLTIKLQVLLE